jgi:DNA-directed RNA polymerase specialized sigma24 family protein
MQIERLPRTCFALRLLLGYPRRVCAQLLGIEESKIETLLQTAIDTLQPSSAEAH